jgi:perosamine synthetase
MKLSGHRQHTQLPRICLDDPNIGELEKKYLNRCIDSTFVSTHGPFAQEFETKFARLLNCTRAVSVQSGTAGLHITLYELGIKPGDEIIVPVLTFVATANAVKYVGAKPVFADVDPRTWVIDPARIEKMITRRTRAIIPVHLFGVPCRMDEIMDIAVRHNLLVIEDATESLGSKYRHQFTGTFGNFGVFSFNGNKLLTTGGGGMVVGSDKKRMKHIEFLVNQARDMERGYYHTEIGFNYRMTNLEAALGLAQLERIGEFIEKKQDTTRIYLQAFRDVEGLKFQESDSESEAIRWLNSLLIDTERTGKTIPDIQRILSGRGIPTRRIFMPITEFPPYKDSKRSRYVNAFRIYENGLCLPSSTLNTEEGIEYVARTVVSLLRRPTRSHRDTPRKMRVEAIQHIQLQ